MADLDKETVDFVPNYDETTEEPTRPAGAVPEPARQRLGRHRRRHGDQHPAAQPARGDRRRSSTLDRAPRAQSRRRRREFTARCCEIDSRARLPDRRHHRRPRGHRAGVPDRPRLHHRCARRPTIEEATKGDQHVDRRHRDPVPGQQGEADREDRRPGPREDDRGHLRPARRVGPRRHAHRHRAEARRGARRSC